MFVGTDRAIAGEGHDRSTLAMPGNYNSLIDQVAALGNPRMALVDPVRRSGGDRQASRASSRRSCSAGTTARARVPRWPRCYSAAQDPSGHLDFTWYRDDSQLPDMSNYGLTPSATGGSGPDLHVLHRHPDLPVRLRAQLHPVQLLEPGVTPQPAPPTAPST